MAKGSQTQLQFHEFRDPHTGARVTRLTPPDVTCHRNYFYQKCFTDDGRHLLFGAWFDNDWNCYLLDRQTGVTTQLTEGAGDNTFGCFLSPDEQYLYYVKGGRELRRLRLDTLAEEIVYRVAEGYTGYGTWTANSDCTKLVGIEVVSKELMALATWQEFREQYLRNPTCSLVRIDIATGTSDSLLRHARWTGHPIYRPFDDNTVAFCHEGPLDLVETRMWLMDEDGSHIRPVKKQEAGERCTHEFWVPDGSKLMYVSYLNRDGHDRWICVADPVTMQNDVLMPMPACSHIMSNHDGSLAVADGSGTPQDMADTKGFERDSDPFIHLFDLKSRTSKPLCAHNSSWREYRANRQVTHPHPGFTPDETQVLFSSDFEGEPAIYLADLPG
ncbi:MAG: oligogalacturonate lyase family protein [Rhodocyclaceae bacterium]